MINVIQGFKLSARDPIDARLLMTKKEMREIKDNMMPDKYFTICKENGLLYIYDKDRTQEEIGATDTGKFTLVNSSKIDAITIDGETLPIDESIVDIPKALADKYGVIKLGTGLKNDDDGTVTIDFNSFADGIIPQSKINFTNGGIISRGYFHDGKFYTSTDYRESIVGYDYKLYIDIPSTFLYEYNTTEKIFEQINKAPLATSIIPGVMKLYGATGDQTDGTMNQKSITDELNKKFTISKGEDESIIFKDGFTVS